MSPLSADGKYITYFEFNGKHAHRNKSGTRNGVVKVANADGTSPKSIADAMASVAQGAMQQWAGETHRVALIDYSGPAWKVIDIDTEDRWQGAGHMRSLSPDGKYMFFQTPEWIHLDAEKENKILSPEEIKCSVVNYQTGETDVVISLSDVLKVHPDAEEVKKQHMCFKQTLFSPDGKYLSFVLSNAYYQKFRPEEEMRHEILIAERDGSNIRYLGPFFTHPAWHPNSKYFFAVSREDKGQMVHRERQGVNRFVLYPVDGGAPVVLGKEKDWQGGGHPGIQPLHYRYLVADMYDRDRGCVTLRLFDLNELTIEDVLIAEYEDYSNESGTHLHPSWSHDGKSVYISSAHSGIAQLYRVDLRF
jgi:Tol biopolymer transport system component